MEQLKVVVVVQSSLEVDLLQNSFLSGIESDCLSELGDIFIGKFA